MTGGLWVAVLVILITPTQMGPDDDSVVVEIDSCNVNFCFFVDITKLDLN